MRLVIGIFFFVSTSLSEYQTRRQVNQNFEIEKNFNNQEALLKHTKNVNSTSVSTNQISATKQGPCYCASGLCACCSKLLFDVWKQKACVNVTYDPDEFSFTTKVLMNNRILYTRTISGKNPRPVCVPVPRFPTVRACVRFYNIYFQGRNAHACINMEGKYRETSLFSVGLDCIRFGANGLAIVKPEDGGGLGQVQFLPEDVPGEHASEYDDYDEEEDDDEEDDLFDY